MKVFQYLLIIIMFAGVQVILPIHGATTSGALASRKYQITAKAWGPNSDQVDAAKRRAENSLPVQALLKGTRYRLISVNYVDNTVNSPTHYIATFYDYTNDRAFIAESDFGGKEPVKVREHVHQLAEGEYFPGIGIEELADAYGVIKADKELGSLYKTGQLQIYDAMPPITIVNGERLVNVGITKKGVEMIVGVGFKNDRVVYYQGGAPPTSLAAPDTCGLASRGCEGTGCENGSAGQAQITIRETPSQDPPLWDLLVIRPRVSSGNPTEGSGIEIRDVKYKGKSVLKRGHVPVLNVQYIPQTCGPYRDWQYSEGAFMAPEAGAENPANGIRILAPGQIATTSLETGDDLGNFKGVAIYTQDVGTGYGQEVVMVSEMNAGWYRYLMEWRFASDGTIRPRYGFGATKNSCVCLSHHHHAYWRFDFDVVQPNNKVFQVERGRKFMRPVLTESKILRNYSTNRGFVIQNANGDEAYQLTPGRTDGTADAFGQNDFWLLQYQGTPASPLELDDLNDYDSPQGITAINIDPWLNNESLVDQDVVVWYAAHFIHNDGANLVDPDRSGLVLNGSHVVGPDLRPIRW
ncbi:MAG: hypothetical protein WBD22_01020 [Pyrinomonadaceae bacterium]